MPGTAISNAQNCAQTTIKTGDCQWWGIAGTIFHVPTGLYVYGGFGETQISFFPGNPGLDDDGTTWFVQAGIERKFIHVGTTTIFGEYRRDDAGFTGTAFTGDNGAGTARISTSSPLASSRTSMPPPWTST